MKPAARRDPRRGMDPPLAMRIVADSNIPGVAGLFGHLGEVRLVNGRQLTPVELRDADVLLIRSVTRADADLLAEMARERLVAVATCSPVPGSALSAQLPAASITSTWITCAGKASGSPMRRGRMPTPWSNTSWLLSPR